MFSRRTGTYGLSLGALGLLYVTTVSSAFAPPPGQWPLLDVLPNYPTPGQQCTLDGAAHAGSDKALSNRLKNRYHLAGVGTEPISLNEVMTLPPPDDASAHAAESHAIHDSNNERYVSVVGFVRSVKPGGISNGESCNCGATEASKGDTHIEVVLDPANKTSGKGMVVVETTYRIRELARLGLLASKLSTTPLTAAKNRDWSTSHLAKRLTGKWVRFDGWLYYDADHHREDWATDPGNKFVNTGKKRKSPPDKHEENWRETCWEVHPVMAIRVLPGKPASL